MDDIVKRVSSWFGRLHALVIGPGAGRDPMMVDCICKLIAKARSMDLPLVLDADALWMLEQRPELIHGYSRAILTPNAAEFARLCSAMVCP